MQFVVFTISKLNNIILMISLGLMRFVSGKGSLVIIEDLMRSRQPTLYPRRSRSKLMAVAAYLNEYISVFNNYSDKIYLKKYRELLFQLKIPNVVFVQLVANN